MDRAEHGEEGISSIYDQQCIRMVEQPGSWS